MKKQFLIFIFSINTLFAHPHFFIDSKLTITDDGIKNEWLFDKLNSKILLFDFDKNVNKVLDEDEKQEFIETHFLPLKDNNYNIFLTLDEEIKIKPQNIDVNFENRRISLSFHIKTKLAKVFTMCTIDEKIYMAYNLKELNSKENLEIQKSEYDYCIGVVE